MTIFDVGFPKMTRTSFVQNFDRIPHVPAAEVGYYGGSVALADYCPYIQEFTWRSNNVVVRGSHCQYQENQPSESAVRRGQDRISVHRLFREILLTERLCRRGSELRAGDLRRRLEVFRPHGADVGGAELWAGAAVAALGQRLLRVHLPGGQAAHRHPQPGITQSHSYS